MPDLPELSLLHRLGVALAVGFLLGIERGWRGRDAGEGQRAAGVRTFSLLGLLGGAAGALAATLGPVIIGVTVIVTGLALALFMYREGARAGDFSATSLVAALLTLLLGAMATVGDARIAAAAAVAATALLAIKGPLHSWVARITWPELKSGLVLAGMTLIALPLLPDHPVDPWQVLNPHDIWLMTILIAAVSFGGYCLVRLAGPRRGALLGAVAGGLVSSTAVTLSLAHLARQNPGQDRLLAGCVVAGGVSMVVRLFVIVALVGAPLLPGLTGPLIAASSVAGVFAAWAVLRPGSARAMPVIALDNPFDLWEVLKFGTLLSAILVGTFAARAALGEPGLLAIAALSGIADVDAVTLMATRLHDAGLPHPLATLAILVAVLVNSVSKSLLALWVGGARFGLWTASANLTAILAGIAAFLLLAQ